MDSIKNNSSVPARLDNWNFISKVLIDDTQAMTIGIKNIFLKFKKDVFFKDINIFLYIWLRGVGFEPTTFRL